MMKIFHTQWINGSWSTPLDASWDSPNTLVLVFGCSDFMNLRQPFDDLANALPQASRLGCSTSGEIYGSEVFDDSLSIAVVQFERTELKQMGMSIAQASSSYQVGHELALKLRHPELRAVFILSDGLNVNGTQLIQGINDALPSGVAISGGLAGDSTRFIRTWVLDQHYPAVNQVVMVGLYGPSIQVHTSSVGGWDTFGPERVITKSTANVLYELDHRPALELYKMYLGHKACELPSSALLFPLALKSEFMDRQGIVRTVLSVDEETQSMTFAGDMPTGSTAQLMRANFDRLVDGASMAATAATFPQSSPDHAILSIAISCVGRRLVLGERIEDETEAVLDILPPQTVQVGFYSYGELSSGKLGRCDLHNQTMTLTTLCEDD